MPRPDRDATSTTPLSRLRNAALVMLAVVAVLWAVQLVDVALHGSLLRFGIVPRTAGKLPDILSAPFLHVSWTHLESNTPPLFVLGVLVAWRGLGRLAAVSAVVMVVAGLGVWLVSPSGTDTVGASGVVFGYLGFLVASGVVERRLVDVAVAVLVGALYWWTLPDLLPGNPAISWQDHVFGLAGGLLAALALHRAKRRRIAAPAGSELAPAGPPPELFNLPGGTSGSR